ncbi:MAG: hypothetical protein WB780_24095 [Candidatus Acidiferrales bacterium]
MACARTERHRLDYFLKCATIIAAIFLISSVCGAQTAPATEAPNLQWLQDIQKNPELMAEIGKLSERLMHGLQYPPPRSESHILPVLPEATYGYAAVPNYGDMVHQALDIFHEELERGPALRDIWHSGEFATAGPKAEDALEKFYQLSQYLGDEIAVAGEGDVKHPGVLFVAQARKPGLDNYLQQMLKQISGQLKPPVRVLRPQDLATAEERRPPEGLLLLVRPDYVVGSLTIDALRNFSAQLDKGGRQFAASPFEQRVAKAYVGGVTGLGAIDLHRILSQVPPATERNRMLLQSTGFADVKYLVWELTKEGGLPTSLSELSFMGPRHGIASWIAAPAPLGSLDFLSPKAILAGALQLKEPVEMFADVEEMAEASSPGALAGLAQMEQMLNVSLKNDLLSHLGGEVAYEVDDITPDKADVKVEWKALLRAKDPDKLQQTLTTLLAAGHLTAEPSTDQGITYYTVRISTAKKTTEIDYAFADGYLIAASSRGRVAEAIQAHQSGESLGKSKKFLAALPPGHPLEASSVFYEDAAAMTMLILRQASPEMAAQIEKVAGQTPPLVACAYGEETAIRATSSSAVYNSSAILIAAAVAIPNLLRSRMAANEASAVGTVRTVNTAQASYAAIYPARGFARDLATLGPDPGGSTASSAEHASLLDANLTAANCTSDGWCTKSGYRFIVTAPCKKQKCDEYVVAGTPVSTDTGVRSFCSTTDAVIRYKSGEPLTAPVSAAECKTWAPLQ